MERYLPHLPQQAVLRWSALHGPPARLLLAEPLCLQTVEVFLNRGPIVMPCAMNIDEVHCVHCSFTLVNNCKLLRATSLQWLLAHLQRHEHAVIYMGPPHECKGLVGAPVTHTEIRDIYYTLWPCDLGDSGSWSVLA